MGEPDGSVKTGKRKIVATLAYTAGAYCVGGLLVTYGKIDGSEFVGIVDSAKYVVLGYLGINLLGAAAQKFSKNGGE